MFSSRKSIMVCLLAAAFLSSTYVVDSHAKARIQLPPSENIKADKASLEGIEQFYDRFEDALAARNLDAIMANYADDYNYNHADKAQLRYLWSEQLAKFDKLYSVHNFSEIDVAGNEAAITCTGILFGLPKGQTNYVIVDRWETQNHYLTKAGDSWKIAGGSTHWVTTKQAIPGKKDRYSLEFHPFF